VKVSDYRQHMALKKNSENVFLLSERNVRLILSRSTFFTVFAVRGQEVFAQVILRKGNKNVSDSNPNTKQQTVLTNRKRVL